MLQLMYKEATIALEKVQLYWKPESLEYITSVDPVKNLPEWTVELQEAGSDVKTNHQCIQREQIKVLAEPAAEPKRSLSGKKVKVLRSHLRSLNEPFGEK